MNLIKIFHRSFWIWLLLCLAGFIYIAITIILFKRGVPQKPIDDNFSWESIVYVLGVICAGGVAAVCRFEFKTQINELNKKQQDNVASKQYSRMLLLMLGAFLLLIADVIIASIFLNPAKVSKPLLACNSILTDAKLYKFPVSAAAASFVTENKDSVNITSLDCNAYKKKKSEIRKELLEKCDARLRQYGYYPAGDKIFKLLEADDDSSISIRTELIRANCYRIDEEIDSINGSYYYKASICVAKKHSIDSLIDAAKAKYCMKWAFKDMINDSLRNSSSATISLSDIIQRVCIHCPGNEYVRRIRAMCNGSYNCDSIYFRSGRYHLSDVSKLILESFFYELQRNSKESYNVDFYGYTDAHRINGSIIYNGDAHVTTLCMLLPDSGHGSVPLTVITNNKDLSFARAYSCYEYMKSQFSGYNLTYRYAGCGERNAADIDSRQRTVKIIITKR